MKINFKKLIISILIPLVLGTIVGFLTGNNYGDLVRPSFAPPGIVFPIVWTILYILMGISSYLVSEDNNLSKGSALKAYYIQLIFNLLWSFVFFTFKLYLLAFIWIIILIILVIIMNKRFFDINKLSGILQIPYIIWLIFASILNLAIFILN